MKSSPLPISILARAWLLLLAETALPAFQPLVTALSCFAASALFDLPSVLPIWLQGVLLALFLGMLGGAGWFAYRRLRLPSRGQAIRRIERASGLIHRPLTTLEDRPVSDGADGIAAALWQEHLRRTRRDIGALRVGKVWPSLMPDDPLGLRLGLVILVLLGWIVAGPEAGERLRRGFWPSGNDQATGFTLSADLWLTPPAYTGLAPLYLHGLKQAPDTAEAPLQIPAGSNLQVQIHGTSATPRVKVDGSSFGTFQALDDTDYTLTQSLVEGKRLRVTAGSTVLIDRSIVLVPDQPPTIQFTAPPTASARGALTIAYDAADDYGVKAVRLEVRQALSSEESERAGDNAPLSIPLPSPGDAQRHLQATSYQDLTSSPLAGQAVDLRLVAEDAAGYSGRSDPLTIMLPERVFHNPVARIVAEQRKLLITHSGDPSGIAGTLTDLASRPDAYRQDELVFMGLTVAAHRLTGHQTHDMAPPTAETLASVEALLWETALRIEDGEVAQIQRSLREAQQTLQNALARHAPSAEISRLMEKLQQQIGRFLQSMAQRNGNANPVPGGKMKTINAGDLQQLLDRARDLAKTGDSSGAQAALAQLQDMLESLRQAKSQPSNSGTNATRDALRSLNDLQRRQQNLMDQSFQKNQQSRGAATKSGEEALAQEALRRALNQLGSGKPGKSGPPGKSSGGNEQGEGDLPAAIGRADRAMGEAAQALKQGNAGDALAPQGDALDALKQAGEALAKQAGKNGEEGDQGDEQGKGEDPMGRGPNGKGALDHGEVKLPAATDVQRSREILDELRRRDGDMERPQEERDYIDRLLKNF